MIAGMRHVALSIAVIAVCVGKAGGAFAGDVRVAVAANFSGVLTEIARQFTADTGYDVLISTGSTGLLYTQIIQGAPFDVFLAADQDRPQRLVNEGFAVSESLFTYAIGRLVLFSVDPGLIDGIAILKNRKVDRLATANPRTAPYGKAAEDVLLGLDLLDDYQGRIVQGANIAQTYQFVATGSVDAGFVALSQVVGHSDGSQYIVPADSHELLAQDAVLLHQAKENPASVAFLSYLRAPAIRQMIEAWGYDVPAGS